MNEAVTFIGSGEVVKYCDNIVQDFYKATKPLIIKDISNIFLRNLRKKQIEVILGAQESSLHQLIEFIILILLHIINADSGA